jgi:GNAT superfamily N-acetyltransferase
MPLSDFHVRELVSHDLDCVLAWLPDSLKGPPTRLAVAEDVATGQIAGAVALRAFSDGGGRCWLFVSPGFRRRGCGMALLQAVQLAARQAKLTSLLTHESYEAAKDEENRDILQFYQARGLSVALQVVRVRGDLQKAADVLEPLYLRYQRRPGISGQAHIVPAVEVDPSSLAAFTVRGVGGIPEEVAARLTGHGQAYDRTSSMAALVDNKIVGAFLTVVRGTHVIIESRVVEATHRGGWVNLALMYRATAAALAVGIKTIEFEYDLLDTDTAKLAKRLEAIEVGLRRCWGCSLADNSNSAERP